MDLIAEPDIYEPNINENCDYVDNIPSINKFKNGIRCSCGSRREHIFDNRQSFITHIKTKTHQKWLQELNVNKMNYYVENIKLKELIENQKIIIAQYEKEKTQYEKEKKQYKKENDEIILHLTKKMAMKENANLELDLINFD